MQIWATAEPYFRRGAGVLEDWSIEEYEVDFTLFNSFLSAVYLRLPGTFRAKTSRRNPVVSHCRFLALLFISILLHKPGTRKSPKEKINLQTTLKEKKDLFCKYKTQHRQLWWELHNMIKVGKGCSNNTGGKVGIELQYRQITEGYLLMRPEGILRALISGPYFYTSLLLQ